MAARENPLASFPYPFRAHVGIYGAMSCPKCGNIASYRTNKGTYRLQCTNRDCRADWAIGLVLRPIAHRPFSSDREPSDNWFAPHVIAGDAWEPGSPVHAVESET